MGKKGENHDGSDFMAMSGGVGLQRLKTFLAAKFKRTPRPEALPNQCTLDFLATTNCKVIAEVGVGVGSTSMAIAQWLDGKGMLHLFDFQERVDMVAEQLRQKGYRNVVAHGNSKRLLDSYNWSLMKLLREHEHPIFDYVYLDGAHTWAVDALAFFLIDRLLRPGGYIDFDDYDWTISSSPTVNPKVYPIMNKLYTPEQVNEPNVKLIVDLLVRRDASYEEVIPNKIFRKLSAA